MSLGNIVATDEGWGGAVRKLLHDRFRNELDNPIAMMDAFVRHNEGVRAGVPAGRLLEWRPDDGWDRSCDQLRLPVPADPFPRSNSTDDFRHMMSIP